MAALLHGVRSSGVRHPPAAGLVALLAVAPLLLAGAAPALAEAPSSALRRATDVGAAWQWPLQPRPRVVRPFAPGPTPYSPGHHGVDLAAAPGQDVQAAGAGRVSYAGLLAGRGVVVVVHGSLRTTYEPLDAAVSVGAEVGRGERLGTVTTGHACPGPCLHWGLRRGDTYLDPLLLVRSPVRLLPQGAADRRAAGVPGSRLLRPVHGSAPEREGASLRSSPRDVTAPHGSSSRPGPALGAADDGRATALQDDAGGAARPGARAGPAAAPVPKDGRRPVGRVLPAASALAGVLVVGTGLLVSRRSVGARRGTPTRRA